MPRIALRGELAYRSLKYDGGTVNNSSPPKPPMWTVAPVAANSFDMAALRARLRISVYGSPSP